MMSIYQYCNMSKNIEDYGICRCGSRASFEVNNRIVTCKTCSRRACTNCKRYVPHGEECPCVTVTIEDFLSEYLFTLYYRRCQGCARLIDNPGRWPKFRHTYHELECNWCGVRAVGLYDCFVPYIPDNGGLRLFLFFFVFDFLA